MLWAESGRTREGCLLSNSHFENIHHKKDTRKLRKKVHFQSVFQSNYGGVLEMSQKVCGSNASNVSKMGHVKNFEIEKVGHFKN